ncbi:MAG: hypothetical protein IIA73_10665 [Proteobacteria bacterium]|nr:hypothetical protein [Pseudomonadota bacterium]
MSSYETYDDTSRHYDRTRVAVGVEIGQITSSLPPSADAPITKHPSRRRHGHVRRARRVWMRENRAEPAPTHVHAKNLIRSNV